MRRPQGSSFHPDYGIHALKNYRFEIILAALLLALFFGFSQWHAPGSKLSQAEVDNYMATIEAKLPWPADSKASLVSHVRAWAEADDGRPVYMLNLMQYYPQLRPLPEVAGFQGSPEESNAFYEEKVIPLLIKYGTYPLFSSNMQGVLSGAQPSTNVIVGKPEWDNWSRVLIVRYPNRRAFLNLLTDPVYMQYVSYKAAALNVGLAPMKGDLILPLLNWALGGVLLILFLAVAWLRALRRAR